MKKVFLALAIICLILTQSTVYAANYVVKTGAVSSGESTLILPSVCTIDMTRPLDDPFNVRALNCENPIIYSSNTPSYQPPRTREWARQRFINVHNYNSSSKYSVNNQVKSVQPKIRISKGVRVYI